MIKGGYKIVDFKGNSLSDTAVTMNGMYAQIVDDYNKTIMVSGVILSGELQDDAYVSVKVGDGYVELSVYGGVITVNDNDEITFASYATPTDTAAAIAGLQEVTKDVHIITLPENSVAQTFRIKTDQNYGAVLAFSKEDLSLFSVAFQETPVETIITQNSPITALTNIESKARQFEVTVAAYKRVTLISWAKLSSEKL